MTVGADNAVSKNTMDYEIGGEHDKSAPTGYPYFRVHR